MSSPVEASTPNIARIYDAFFEHGTNHYAIDRAHRDEMLRIAPDTTEVVRTLRDWLGRVVRYLTREALIEQFLDLGSGLPTQGNTHQVAQAENPKATVVYVDNDPTAATYGRTLLDTTERAHVAIADLTRPHEVLNNDLVRGQLDWTRPIALLQCATLDHLSDACDPAGLMRQYAAALPTGSYVGLTHRWEPGDNGEYTTLARSLEQLSQRSDLGTAVRYRTLSEVETMFPDLDLLPPHQHTEQAGLSLVQEWWPLGPQLGEPSTVAQLLLGGLARKP